MNKLTKTSLALGTFLTPMFAFAQNGTQLFAIVDMARVLVNKLIPIVLAVIFLMIIWNAFKMINADGEEKSDYKQGLMKSVIIFFVVVSLWGIIYFIANTIGIGPTTNNTVPCAVGTYNPVTKACE